MYDWELDRDIKSHIWTHICCPGKTLIAYCELKKNYGQEEEYACNFLKTPNYMFIYRSIYVYLPGQVWKTK